MDLLIYLPIPKQPTSGFEELLSDLSTERLLCQRPRRSQDTALIPGKVLCYMPRIFSQHVFQSPIRGAITFIYPETLHVVQ